MYLYLHVWIQVSDFKLVALMPTCCYLLAGRVAMAPYYMSEEQQYTACWELMESEREKSGSEILLAGNFFRIYRCEFVCLCFLIGATCYLIDVSHKSRKLMLILCPWVICNLFPSIVVNGCRSLLPLCSFPSQHVIQGIYFSPSLWFDENS